MTPPARCSRGGPIDTVRGAYRTVAATAYLVATVCVPSTAHAQEAKPGPVVAVSAGALRSGEQTSVAGEARLGFLADAFGGVGEGEIRRLRFATPSAAWNQDEMAGRANGYFSTGHDGDKLRLSFGAHAGLRRFKTATVLFPPGATVLTTAERSSLLQGGATAGLRARPSDALRLFVHAGGGIQREAYKQVAVGSSLDLTADRSLSLRLLARGGGAWAFLPERLGTQISFSVESYRRTRDRTTLTGDGGQLGQTLDELSALELSGRVELLALLAGFLGSAPGVYLDAGFEQLRSSDSTIRVTHTTLGVTWSPTEL